MEEDLKAFLINIANEAKKGYYNDSDEWIDGYLTAIEDISERIEAWNCDDENTLH